MFSLAPIYRLLIHFSRILLPLLLISFITPSYAQAPSIEIATQYRQGINVQDYFVSEKLDGIRGYWDGKHLYSKQGTAFTAPNWFTAHFPNTPLDGELWIGRNQFETVSGIVRTQDDQNTDWKRVKFMIFDLPSSPLPFSQRVIKMRQLISESNAPYLRVIEQKKLPNSEALYQLLDKVVALKGEGLVLHHEDALYQHKRSKQLMKLKKFEDADATVIGYIPGKGKYTGMLGALQVKTPQGLQFKIGTGFSDKERKNPPPIGSTIIYKYTGKTKNNIPRFATFMRIRVNY